MTGTCNLDFAYPDYLFGLIKNIQECTMSLQSKVNGKLLASSWLSRSERRLRVCVVRNVTGSIPGHLKTNPLFWSKYIPQEISV